mmetsp:Transcript_11832/g.30293  ORF Transcript_11832/g.30293 Transcript_11832/m.30293 type:complete len:284 (+) Transcript_11832:308-1159(+)
MGRRPRLSGLASLQVQHVQARIGRDVLQRQAGGRLVLHLHPVALRQHHLHHTLIAGHALRDRRSQRRLQWRQAGVVGGGLEVGSSVDGTSSGDDSEAGRAAAVGRVRVTRCAERRSHRVAQCGGLCAQEVRLRGAAGRQLHVVVLRLQQQRDVRVAQQVGGAEAARQQLLQGVRLARRAVAKHKAQLLRAAQLAVELAAVPAGRRGDGHRGQSRLAVRQHVDEEELLRMHAVGERQPAELQVDANVDVPAAAAADGAHVEGTHGRPRQAGRWPHQRQQQLVVR